MELENCPSCGNLYVKNAIRSTCEQCYKQEEKDFETVYQYLRIRENRAATISQVATATNVKEDLLYKWVRRGRLQTVQFPNLGYPCDRCGKIIQKAQLCEGCQSEITQDLEMFNKEQARQEELRRKIYLSRENE